MQECDIEITKIVRICRNVIYFNQKVQRKGEDISRVSLSTVEGLV